MDEEKNKRLEEIEVTLKQIHKILKPTRWQLFLEGLWRAFGYLVGLMIAIVLIGWLLNVIGVIPVFNKFASNMQEVLDVVKAK